MLSIVIYSTILLLTIATYGAAEVLMNREGCGSTKACLFKPSGCDPNLDCTIGLIFYVVGPNKLRVEMVATSLIPAVQQQYIAIAFSNDAIMGDDFVTECVLSDGQFAGWEPEIFISYNHGKANDRIHLNDDEHKQLISNVSSQVIDGRLVCHFTQQIVPQIARRDGLLWSLDKPFYIMGATGSAQPDEVNAHDTNRGSHFYPIVSSAKINPAAIGGNKFPLPMEASSGASNADTTASVTSSTPSADTSSTAAMLRETSVASTDNENSSTDEGNPSVTSSRTDSSTVSYSGSESSSIVYSAGQHPVAFASLYLVILLLRLL